MDAFENRYWTFLQAAVWICTHNPETVRLADTPPPGAEAVDPKNQTVDPSIWRIALAMRAIAPWASVTNDPDGKGCAAVGPDLWHAFDDLMDAGRIGKVEILARRDDAGEKTPVSQSTLVDLVYFHRATERTSCRSRTPTILARCAGMLR